MVHSKVTQKMVKCRELVLQRTRWEKPAEPANLSLSRLRCFQINKAQSDVFFIIVNTDFSSDCSIRAVCASAWPLLINSSRHIHAFISVQTGYLPQWSCPVISRAQLVLMPDYGSLSSHVFVSTAAEVATLITPSSFSWRFTRPPVQSSHRSRET